MKGLTSYSFHVGDGETVRPQIAEDLVVQQLLFHGIIEINVLIKEEMLLEQEHMMTGLFGQRPAGRSVLFPLGHDVSHLLVREKTSLLSTQYFVNCIALLEEEKKKINKLLLKKNCIAAHTLCRITKANFGLD